MEHLYEGEEEEEVEDEEEEDEVLDEIGGPTINIIPDELNDSVSVASASDENIVEHNEDNEAFDSLQINEGLLPRQANKSRNSRRDSNSSAGSKASVFVRASRRDETKEIMETYWQEMRTYEFNQRQEQRKRQKSDLKEKQSVSRKSIHRERRQLQPSASRSSKSPAVKSDTDDTDLEIEGEKGKMYNDSVVYLYEAACKNQKVVPLGQFKFQLEFNQIRINDLSLRAKDVIPMCIALVRKTNLTKIDFAGNLIGIDGLKYVLQLVKELPTLADLNISNNGLDSKAAELLHVELENVTHLKKINLSHNHFEAKDSDFLADIIRNLVSLRTFIISHNNLGEEGGVAIGRSLSENSTLDSLSINWCNIRLKGAEAIAASLKENANLDYLDVSWNGFCDQGAMALADALKVNTTLTALNLAANRVGPLGVLALAQSLAINESLEELNLDMNPITTRGADELILQCKKNAKSQLQRLDVGSISVSYETASLVQRTHELHAQTDATSLEKESTPTQAPFLLRCDSFVRFNPSRFSNEIIKDGNDLKGDPFTILKLYVKTQNIRLDDMLSELLKENRSLISATEMKRLLKRIPLPISDDRIDQFVDLLPTNAENFIDVQNFFDIIHKEPSFHYDVRTIHSEKLQSNSVVA